MAEINDHLLREILRLTQYLDLGQPLLTMDLTRRLRRANDMAANVLSEWAPERKVFEQGLEKGIEIAKKTSRPAEVTEVISASSTDWLALGACLLMAAPMVYCIGKHTCEIVGKYLTYRTELAHQAQQTPAAAEHDGSERSTATSGSDLAATNDAAATEETATTASPEDVQESMELNRDWDEPSEEWQGVW